MRSPKTSNSMPKPTAGSCWRLRWCRCCCNSLCRGCFLLQPLPERLPGCNQAQKRSQGMGQDVCSRAASRHLSEELCRGALGLLSGLRRVCSRRSSPAGRSVSLPAPPMSPELECSPCSGRDRAVGLEAIFLQRLLFPHPPPAQGQCSIYHKGMDRQKKWHLVP